MLIFVELLRAIATAFVLNSHCKGVYPIELTLFGEYGLALFFILTGYLIANITKETLFINWFPKKFLRIYVPLILWNIVLLLLGKLNIDSVNDFIANFVYPTNMWFASFIVIMYIVYFILNKYVFLYHSQRRIYYCIIALLIFYFSIYLFENNDIPHNSTLSWHTRILWFVCSLVGLALRKTKDKNVRSKHSSLYFILAAVFMILYGVEKILFVKHILLSLQCLCLIFPIISAVFLFVYMESIENKLSKLNGKWLKLVKLLSGASFEIYLVQFVIINAFKKIAFPINLVLIVVISILCGNIVNYISRFLIDSFEKISKRTRV